MIHFSNMNVVGILPEFFSEHDERPAREQLHTAYAHGGGVQPFEGFTVEQAPEGYTITYEGEPPLHEISRATVRDELLVFFPHAWLMIMQPTGETLITRVD